MRLRQTHSDDVREGYTDILGRVDAIALVHDALYASDELTRVPVSNYLRKLCDSLVQLRGREDKVSIRLEAEDADISLDKAVTVGLITTELVTNALKHAFPNGMKGEILVDFRCKNGECTLVVSDDGVGLASRQSNFRSRSGLRLVSSLALQLGAELSEAREPGTTVCLQFPQS
jgi:two-component sensor histidine kinase